MCHEMSFMQHNIKLSCWMFVKIMYAIQHTKSMQHLYTVFCDLCVMEHTRVMWQVCVARWGWVIFEGGRGFLGLC